MLEGAMTGWWPRAYFSGEYTCRVLLSIFCICTDVSLCVQQSCENRGICSQCGLCSRPHTAPCVADHYAVSCGAVTGPGPGKEKASFNIVHLSSCLLVRHTHPAKRRTTSQAVKQLGDIMVHRSRSRCKVSSRHLFVVLRKN